MVAVGPPSVPTSPSPLTSPSPHLTLVPTSVFAPTLPLTETHVSPRGASGHPDLQHGHLKATPYSPKWLKCRHITHQIGQRGTFIHPPWPSAASQTRAERSGVWQSLSSSCSQPRDLPKFASDLAGECVCVVE